MAKHFRHDSPFHREVEPINIDDTTDESAVQGEYSDSVEASAGGWQASEELSTGHNKEAIIEIWQRSDC